MQQLIALVALVAVAVAAVIQGNLEALATSVFLIGAVFLLHA